MELSRDFKGVWIPREIWLNKDLSLTAKCLLVEIDSLDKEGTGCYASNQYLAEFLGISESRLASLVSELRGQGWIKDVSFDGRIRRISLTNPCQKEQGSIATNNKAGLPKMARQGCQKRQHSNIVDNKVENSMGKSQISATLEDRVVTFLSMVNLFKGTYPDDMLKAFFDYWSEPNAKGKMRFELQETWETGRRLATWNRNNSKFGPKEQRNVLNEAKLSLDEIRRQREASR